MRNQGFVSESTTIIDMKLISMLKAIFLGKKVNAITFLNMISKTVTQLCIQFYVGRI